MSKPFGIVLVLELVFSCDFWRFGFGFGIVDAVFKKLVLVIELVAKRKPKPIGSPFYHHWLVVWSDGVAGITWIWDWDRFLRSGP